MTCQKVIIINQGRIEAEGTPENLVSRLGDATAILTTVEGDPARAREVLTRVAGIKKVSPARVLDGQISSWRLEPESGRNPRAEVAAAVHDAGLKLLELQTQGLTLEDLFLRVISGTKEAA